MIDDQGEPGQEGRPVDAGRRCSACRRCPRPATSSASPPTRRPPAPSARPASTACGSRDQRGDARVKTGAKLEDIFSQIQAGETATLNLILKADVHGLARGGHREPAQARARRGRADVRAPRRRRHHRERHHARRHHQRHDHRLQRAPGPQGPRAGRTAEDVEIRTYEIIYKLLEDIEQAMVGMLAPEYEEVVTGEAEVREIFRVPRIGAIAGCYVQIGHDHPRLEGPLPPRRHDHLEGRDHVAQAVQGRRRARSARASSAASACPTSRTSSPATSSRPSTSARSRAS